VDLTGLLDLIDPVDLIDLVDPVDLSDLIDSIDLLDLIDPASTPAATPRARACTPPRAAWRHRPASA
jgi:hypothetical protein